LPFASARAEVKALRNVLFGLFGINREQVEKLVTKQLEDEGVEIRGDRGTIPISQHVKAMINEKLFQEFQRIQNKKQAQEYDKLLEETNDSTTRNNPSPIFCNSACMHRTKFSESVYRNI